MKKVASLILVIATVVVVAAQTNTTAGAVLSPAEQSMATAQKLIEKNPKNYEAYNALALALSRRARETSDVKFYSEAEAALQKSFEISPDNFDGARIHVWLLLGKHEFAAALQEGAKLNKEMPDDVMIYGFLTDANVELGNYDAAEAACQRMLDLRTGNLPGITRAAYLRELFGNVDGALELMNMAFQSTPPAQAEDGAWILTQMAHLQLATGNLDKSEKLLRQALTMFPGYHYALGNLAKVRIQQKRYGEAVELLQQRYQAAPHAENLYDLAEALQLAGKDRRSKEGFCGVRAKVAAGNEPSRQLKPRAHLLLCRPCKRTGESAGSGQARDRAPARCLHARRLRMGALRERAICRSAQADRNRARRRHSRCEDLPSCR